MELTCLPSVLSLAHRCINRRAHTHCLVWAETSWNPFVGKCQASASDGTWSETFPLAETSLLDVHGWRSQWCLNLIIQYSSIKSLWDSYFLSPQLLGEAEEQRQLDLPAEQFSSPTPACTTAQLPHLAHQLVLPVISHAETDPGRADMPIFTCCTLTAGKEFASKKHFLLKWPLFNMVKMLYSPRIYYEPLWNWRSVLLTTLLQYSVVRPWGQPGSTFRARVPWSF